MFFENHMYQDALNQSFILGAFFLQVYFYSFDVFRAAGIQQHQLRYVALGTGLCELTTSLICVSPFTWISHHVFNLFCSTGKF